MKILNDFIAKVGEDKVLHFAIGGWAVSAVYPLGINAIGITFLIVMILSFIKEQYLDDNFDVGDIVASFIGSFISFLIYILAITMLN